MDSSLWRFLEEEGKQRASSGAGGTDDGVGGHRGKWEVEECVTKVINQVWRSEKSVGEDNGTE